MEEAENSALEKTCLFPKVSTKCAKHQEKLKP